jgi:hypothetical protein
VTGGQVGHQGHSKIFQEAREALVFLSLRAAHVGAAVHSVPAFVQVYNLRDVEEGQPQNAKEH